MKKYKKLFLRMACSVLGLLGVYQLYWYVVYSLIFNTTVYSQVVSPDGKTMASVIQVDEGATGGFNRQVFLTPTHTLFATSELHNGHNEVMLISGEPQIHLSWRGSNNLVVDYRNNQKPDIDYQKTSWHDISVTYLGRKWVPPPVSTTITITTP